MVVKTNTIKWKCDTKKNELNELEEKINSLNAKRQILE